MKHFWKTYFHSVQYVDKMARATDNSDEDGRKVMTIHFPKYCLKIKGWLVLCCLMPLSAIFQLYRGGQFYWWRKPEGPGENHQFVGSHRQTLSHNVVHLALIEIRKKKIKGYKPIMLTREI